MLHILVDTARYCGFEYRQQTCTDSQEIACEI